MPDSPINPYASPAIQDPTAPDAGSPILRDWEIQGDNLSVRHDGILPPVDLLEGDDSDLLPATMKSSTQRSMTLTKGGQPATASIHYFVSRKAALVDSRKQRPGLVLTMTFGPIVAFFALKDRISFDNSNVGLVLGCLVVLNFLILRRIVRRRPVSLPLKNGRLQLKQVAPTALRRLEALQFETYEPPPPRLLKVFGVHLDRFPLAAILGRKRWNPLFLFFYFLGRATRPNGWNFDAVHPIHRVTIPESSIPDGMQQLIDEWRTSSPDFASWTLVEAFRIPALAHHVLRENVQLCSADRGHSVILSLTTNVLNSIVTRERSCSYSTLVTIAQGELLYVATTNGALLPKAHPAGLEIHRATGNPAFAWQHHLAALSDRAVLPTLTINEWIKRRDDFDERNMEASQAAGYYGPLREILTPFTPGKP